MALTKERDATPLFEPLGYHTPRRGQSLYYFMIDGVVRCFQAYELQAMAFLFELHSDVTHWRGIFPGERRGKVDTLAAAGHFTRLCRERGEYSPPTESHPARE